MNEELFNPKPEKEPRLGKDATSEKSSMPKAGNRLSTIFLVVLALHIVVIIGIVGFQLLRGKAKSDLAESTEQTAPASEVAAKSPEEVTTPEGQPTIETNVAPAAPVANDGTQQAAPVAATEPAWSNPVPVAAPTAPQEKIQPVQPVVAAETAKSSARGTIAGTYTVVSGDSLFKISRKSGVSVNQLREANGLSSDVLKIGQKLNIPSSGKMVASSPAKAEKKAAAAAQTEAGKASGNYYTVAKGDTLNRIARNFNTTPAKIADLNKIIDPGKIKIGMKLKVPAQSTASQNVNTSEASSGTATQPATQFRAPQNADLAMLREGERK